MRLLLALLLSAMSVIAEAQEKLTATVDKTTVRAGETLQLTLSFDGAGSGVPQPSLPALDKLQVVGGPYTNTTTSIVNFKVSSSTSYTYVLRAKEVGKGSIGKATLNFRGKVYESAPITINIVAAGANIGKGASGKDASEVFIRVSADKTEAYLGEQITLTYKIFFSVQISNPEFVKLPRTAGFWVEDLPVPNNLPLTDEVVNGKAYKAAVIRRSALFPTSVGELEVEPMVISAKVERRTQRRSRDPFDIFNDPFFQLGGRLEPVEIESPSVKLRIKPLPQRDVPTGFAGVVGSYKLRATLDKSECTTNDAVTLTIQIEGTGNIKTLPEPVLTLPPDIERYDPKATEQIRREGNRISGVKTYEYVLIPRAPGTQVISAIQYVFFDPDKEKYSILTAPELTLQVAKGEGGSMAQGGIAVATKRGVETISSDIAYVKSKLGHYSSTRSMPHQGFTFWTLTVAPWAAFGAVVSVIRRRARPANARSTLRGASKLALKRISVASKSVKSGKKELIYRPVAEALDTVASAVVGHDVSKLTETELKELWMVKGLDAGVLERLRDIQRECDWIQYTSEKYDRTSAEQLISNAKQVVRQASQMTVREEAA